MLKSKQIGDVAIVVLDAVQLFHDFQDKLKEAAVQLSLIEGVDQICGQDPLDQTQEISISRIATMLEGLASIPQVRAMEPACLKMAATICSAAVSAQNREKLERTCGDLRLQSS